jgi:epoxyqueuosine reductase QueG
MAWGCDICADVCPHNQNPKATPIAAFKRNILPVLSPENLDSAMLTKPYSFRGKEVLKRNLEIISEKEI